MQGNAGLHVAGWPPPGHPTVGCLLVGLGVRLSPQVSRPDWMLISVDALWSFSLLITRKRLEGELPQSQSQGSQGQGHIS